MKEKGKFSRRDFLLISAAAAGGAIASSCAPAEPEIMEVEVTREVEVETMVEVEKTVEVTAVPAGPEVKRISFWTPVSQSEIAGEVHYAITQNFNDEHQGDIYVEYVFTPLSSGRLGMSSLSEKLLTNIAAGTPPEAAYMDRFIVISWAADGALADIGPYAELAGVGEDDYISWCWLEGVWKGGVYCLPLFTDLRALYYNKEHIREAGLSGERDDFPQGPGSLSELDRLAEELTTKEGPRYTRLGFIPWYGMNVYNIGDVFGAEYYDPDTLMFNFTDPKMIAGMEWMQTYASKFDIAKIDAIMDGFGGGAQHGLASGQVSMQYRGNWEIANHRKYAPDMEFTTIDMPYPEGGKPHSYGGGWAVVIPKGSPDPDTAWEFISYFGNADNMNWHCQEGAVIPVHKKYLDDPFYHEDPEFETFINALPFSGSRPRVPVGAELWAEIRAEVQDQLIHGEGDPAGIMEDLNEWANNAMEPYRS